tara:strand:- start:269 stop:451 length:183 start_codon:yes stop_codon:yes gene_type:complete
MFLANEIKNMTKRILPTIQQDKEFLNILRGSNNREIDNNRPLKMKESKQGVQKPEKQQKK